MLEKIASKFQTGVLVLLVTLLSLVFILQFGGPQAEGCTAGGGSYAVKIYGDNVTEGDFRAAYLVAGFNNYSIERARALRARESILDGLIDAKLLAREARQMGYEVTEDQIWEQMRDEGTVRLTLGADASVADGEIPFNANDRDGNFDPELAKRIIQNHLRRSIREFAEWQIDEQLAERARDTIAASVRVSPQEIWNAFVQERDRAKIGYVRFSRAYYRNQLEPDEEELNAWMEENADQVEQEYQANRHRYTGLEPQVRARHILIKAAASDGEEAREAARTRAEELRARAEAGEDFAALASEFSEDTGSARRGGDLGYNPRGRMVGPFDEAQFALEPGEVSEVVETQFGFHVIKSEGKREGDVPEDEAKRELSERLYLDARAGELARQAAESALEALRSGVDLADLEDHIAGRTAAPAEGEETAEGEAAEGEETAEAEAAEEEPDPLAPKVEESRSFGRTDNPISGPFDSGPLVREAFERTLDEPHPAEPIQLGQDWFVFELVERTEALEEDLTDAVRERLSNGLLSAKRREVLRAHLIALREQAEADGAIRIDESVLRYGDEEEAEEGEDEESDS